MDYKRITIFGGTGFIGRHIVDKAAEEGWTVRVPSRRASSAYFLRTAGMVGQIVPEKCNILSDDDLRKVIQGSDMVINCIGLLAEKKKGDFVRFHQELPARIARISQELGVRRFIHFSALGADPDVDCEYLKTKYLGEVGAREAFPLTTIIRPSIVFGKGDGFFNLFARMAMISPFLPLIGGGKTLFQPVYVGDIVQVVMKSLKRTGERRLTVKGSVFELGGPDQEDFKQLIERVMHYTGRKRFLVQLPWRFARMKASILQKLPGQLMTVDQVNALKYDNIVSSHAKTFEDMNILPRSMDEILPTYLTRFREGGTWSS